MHPNLTVFKASAGSGKTFTLAVEYIKLLIQNPEAYRSILAVTFTNKATEEMKMRILSQLYGLAHRLPDSQPYMDAILNDNANLNANIVAKQAEKALEKLLDNYHYFRVQTIDTFFQSVLRNLARELQLNANLRVGLNNQQVVEEAVDELVDSISGNHQLKSVIMGYVRDNMENDKAWNIIGDIKKFGSTIFREFYKQHRKDMNRLMASPTFFDNYLKEMDGIIRTLPAQYQKIGEKAMQILQQHELSVDDFSYGRGGAIGYFIKMAEGSFFDIDMTKTRMVSAINDPSSWATKTSPKATDIITLAEQELIPLMKNTEAGRKGDVRKYLSAIQTRKHINDVRLLKDIEDSARELNDAAQRFMLSDTQSLLNDMIKGEDSPFVFEKIGAHLEHIMIDEFQDTSTVQWANFKKLLEECMSQGKSNLIVGDVKQSIYRFRSGDWRLLNGIENEFPPHQLEFKPRLTNYRSDRNIIAFNNAFFKIAAQLEVAGIQDDDPAMASQLQKAYEDVQQLIPNAKCKVTGVTVQEPPAKGFVHIDLLPESEYADMTAHVTEIVDELLQRGARQKDIAVLLRYNTDVVTLATALEAHGITVVSAEAFRLDASTAVRIIIGAMKYLAHPDDKLTLALLKKDYGHEVLPGEFTENEDSIRAMSLHDMAEEISRIFNLGNSEGAYLSAFYDQLHAFTTDTSTVLSDFLEAWDSDICGKTIETPDSDGIRILTIHKSKGLEFKHVILPYCNWRLEHGRGQIWCHPKEPPFDKMPLVPIDYNSVETLKKTIYSKEAIEEHVQNIVDNLNLLYVAMTRAGSSLFILGQRTKPSKNGTISIKRISRSGVIEQAIPQLGGILENIHIDNTDKPESPLCVTYGTLDGIFDVKEEKKSDNVFIPHIEDIDVAVCSIKNNAVFRQSNSSRAFADEEYDQSDRQRYIRMGTVMHQVFSEIHTLDDVLPVLQRMEFDGALYDEELTKEDFLTELKKKFSNTQIKDWFSGRWQLYNECTIVTKNAEGVPYEQRPDRVMTDGKETIVVDFKFGKPMAEHYDQVRNYMSLLSEMGMPSVKGYLWYVTFGEVKEVKKSKKLRSQRS